MTLNEIFTALESTRISASVRGDIGWVWLFQTIETVHVLSFAVMFGSILMVDLRLMGISSNNLAVSKLLEEALPYTWICFSIAAISGAALFVSKPQAYFYNLPFELKLAGMTLAGLNMLVFHFGAYRHVFEWNHRLPTPRAARAAGAISIILWVGVIFLGRWIGFTT